MVWRCLFSVNIITKKYEKNSSYNVIKNELWVKIGSFSENMYSHKRSLNRLKVEDFPRNSIKNSVLKRIFGLKGKDFLVRKKIGQLFVFSEQLTFSFKFYKNITE